MLPSITEMMFPIFWGFAIAGIGLLIGINHRKWAAAAEILLAAAFIGWMIYKNGFLDSLLLISLLSTAYFSLFLAGTGYRKYRELKEELGRIEAEEWIVSRNAARIWTDILISLAVFLGAILFLIFGPEASPLKVFLLFGLIAAWAELGKRVIVFVTLRIYFSEENNMLFIVSKLDCRELPLYALKEYREEEAADILRLHPLLTLFTSNSDFTTSLGQVQRLGSANETIYLNIADTDRLKEMISCYPECQTGKEAAAVLPLYHWKNLKRLAGKLYYAVTVKGISAYTSIILILYFLEVNSWVIAASAFLYWLINLYLSDRVLKIAMDAKEIQNAEIRQMAERIFAKAGIPGVKVYETDSPQYNGLATGMNIGRGMVTITTATLSLPPSSIESILAHEAIHVKKRDVLWSQIWRIAYFLMLALCAWLLLDRVPDITEYPVPVFIGVWLLMMFLPIYQSFISQWMEVRADQLGAQLLEGGYSQMAGGLADLAERQDHEVNQSAEYRAAKDEKRRVISSLKRDKLIWRLIEFQFMPHPPMYWRVQTLKNSSSPKGMIKRWAADRMRESFTR
ncbi:M56 family metallopeptidase [Bacillus infantis]|uniref:M56 family metallopeptidase n=1 Tax=Bacillus infantis TaxID=324767 RepID=UPI00209D65DD|nr:M56 family metallopeptidase [Bacillus infantis]MCP1158911.1 M56 family metallopeptidase [Bacillus infantis]